MVHDLLFYTLLLLGLLGLCASLIWAWRRRHKATSHTTTAATRRSPAPTPFPGLTYQPSCAACEDEAQEQAKTLPSAPSPMVPIRGCPRSVDTQYHFQPSSQHPGSSALLVIRVNRSKIATSEARVVTSKLLVNQWRSKPSSRDPLGH